MTMTHSHRALPVDFPEGRDDDAGDVVLALGLGERLPAHLHDHVDQHDGEESQQAEHEPGAE